MHWTCVGHAMWLAEAGGLRLLFDPLLAPTHHGGVFDVVPKRQVHVQALRPDFIFVSHRHPDHFDVASLHALARLDPESVVVTPDALVVWAAERLGFSTVRRVPAGQRIELDGLTVVTTPSLDPREWGAMVAADDAVVWNQVDTVLRDEAHVQAVVAAALAGLGGSGLTLGLVRWQPMLEIAAALGRATAFPYDEYSALLRQIAAVGANTVAPSACGGAHVGAYRWLDRHVFPLSAARFVADFTAMGTNTSVLEVEIGTRLDVAAGTVSVAPGGASDLVTLGPSAPDGRDFDPLSVPKLCDPGLGESAASSMRPVVQRWIEGDLVAALSRTCRTFGDQPLRLVVSVVYESAVDVFTIAVTDGVARCERRRDPEWDLLNEIAGSMLFEVIEGRRNWGDVLLAGCLRARTRAYAVGPRGLARLEIAEIFLYYALSYDRSVERAVHWEVARVLGERVAD